MATLFDAMMVTIGLDASEFEKGSKKVSDTTKKLKDKSGSDFTAIEGAAKKTADGLRKIALEALAMFAVFAGARSLGSFITDLVKTDAAVGRLSHNLGTAPQTLEAWGKAAERMGGSAEATQKSISGLFDTFEGLSFGEGLPEAISQLSAFTHVAIDFDHGSEGFIRSISAMVAAGDKIDPQKTSYLARAIGLDDATMAIMQKHGADIKKYLDSLKPLTSTPEQIEQAQKFQEKWAEVAQKVQRVLQDAFYAVSPAIEDLIKQFDGWLSDPKVVEQIKSVITEIANWAKDPATLQNIKDLATSIGDAVQALISAINGIANVGSTTANTLSFISNPSNGEGSVIGKGSYFRPHASKEDAKSGDYYYADDGLVYKLDGARALGGPVSGGKHYLVGENGPEIFSPGSSGTIIPNGGAGSAFSGFGGGADTTVDGKKVNRSNPMPVKIEGGGGTSGENWLQTLGRWATGDAPSGGGGFLDTAKNWLGLGGGSGGTVPNNGGKTIPDASYSPPPGEPGKHRPVYKLSDADLSDEVVNVINGEATSSKLSTDAVINSMFNRLGTKAYGPSGNLRHVALAPGQFAANPHRQASAKRKEEIRERIRAIASGGVEDVTGGANEYRAGWYRGQWFRKHASAPVIGGNRFAVNNTVAPGPYAPYKVPFNNIPQLPRAGARLSAGEKTTNVNRTSTNTSHIDKVVIHTQATDAKGIAKSIGGEVKKQWQQVAAVNYGPA